MNVIAITTSTRQGSVAVLTGDSPPLERTFTRETEHGRGLALALRELLSELHVDSRRVGLVSVDIGPGSHTGLRVGIAAAQMLAFTSNAPLIGVRCLDAIVEALPADVRAACAILDARWGKAFACLYSRDGGDWRRDGEPFLGPVSELVGRIDEITVVVGPGLEAHEAAVRAKTKRIASCEFWFPRAVSLASAALKRLKNGEKEVRLDIEPEYFRSV
jgi:tRNA threonylcarbamoyladenosine biosynthesis protein TsaB